jgi:hypothetical protein
VIRKSILFWAWNVYHLRHGSPWFEPLVRLFMAFTYLIERVSLSLLGATPPS